MKCKIGSQILLIFYVCNGLGTRKDNGLRAKKSQFLFNYCTLSISPVNLISIRLISDSDITVVLIGLYHSKLPESYFLHCH